MAGRPAIQRQNPVPNRATCCLPRPRALIDPGGVNPATTRGPHVLRNEPEITPELVAEHGLKPDEYERILKLIGRKPTFTELGIFSAM